MLSFLYGAALYVLFCVGLVWSLRRALPTAVAVVVAFLAVAALPMPLLEVGLLSAVFACFWLLEAERSPRLLERLRRRGGDLRRAGGADQALDRPARRGGPAHRPDRGAGGAAGGSPPTSSSSWPRSRSLWLATGQSFGDVPDFVHHTLQISSGYSSAMLRSTDVAPLEGDRGGDRRGRLRAGAGRRRLVSGGGRDRAGALGRRCVIAALVSFAIYKEGVVRIDAGHLTVLFANAAVLWLAVGLGGPHRRWMLAGAAIVFAISLPVRPAGLDTQFNPVSNLRFAFDQARTLVSPGRRDDLTDRRAGRDAGRLRGRAGRAGGAPRPLGGGRTVGDRRRLGLRTRLAPLAGLPELQRLHARGSIG